MSADVQTYLAFFLGIGITLALLRIIREKKKLWREGNTILPTHEEADLAISNALLMVCSLDDDPVAKGRIVDGLGAANRRIQYLEKFAPIPDDLTQGTSHAMEMWWSLSYAQYLTIPRSVIQSMPIVWQNRFAILLQELDAEIDWRPKDGCYWCRLRDSKGRLVHDPLMEYRHAPLLPLNSARKEVQTGVSND